MIEDFAEPFRDERIEGIVGIDALGFVGGTGVALDLRAGFLPLRKGGKLPLPETDLLRREVTDYTGERTTLEIDAARISPDERILIVDDWMETGAQMDAAITLVERAGGTVVGVAVLDAERTDRSETIATEYPLHTVNPETTL